MLDVAEVSAVTDGACGRGTCSCIILLEEKVRASVTASGSPSGTATARMVMAVMMYSRIIMKGLPSLQRAGQHVRTAKFSHRHSRGERAFAKHSRHGEDACPEEGGAATTVCGWSVYPVRQSCGGIHMKKPTKHMTVKHMPAATCHTRDERRAAEAHGAVRTSGISKRLCAITAFGVPRGRSGATPLR